jgi:hypothetical protein
VTTFTAILLCTSLALAQPATDPATDPPAEKSLRARAMDAIKARRFGEAEELIYQGRKTRSSKKRDDWTIIEAHLERERGNHARSALIAMRLVILRPDSDEVGTALYWTARNYEDLGRPNKSIQLYEEAAAHKSASAGLTEAARRRIARLRERPEKPTT